MNPFFKEEAMCVGSSHGGIHKMSLESICNARVQRRIRLENRHLGGSNLHAWLGLTWIGSRGRVAINWEMSRGLEVTARKGHEKKEHHKLANWRPAALGHPFRCTVLWGPLPCQPFAYRTGIPGTTHLGRPQSRSRSRQERFVPCSSGGARPPPSPRCSPIAAPMPPHYLLIPRVPCAAEMQVRFVSLQNIQ